MDFRAAVAICRKDSPWWTSSFGRICRPRPSQDDISSRIESLPRPPVREGPVALLAFLLVRGGSQRPARFLPPTVRALLPHRMSAPYCRGADDAEAACLPGRGTSRLADGRRTPLQPAQAGVPPPTALSSGSIRPSAESGPPCSLPRASSAAKVCCNRRKGQCKFPEGQHSLDEITAADPALSPVRKALCLAGGDLPQPRAVRPGHRRLYPADRAWEPRSPRPTWPAASATA